MSDFGLNVAKNDCFLQHLTPSQTFITSKKINYDSRVYQVLGSVRQGRLGLGLG